MLLGEFKHNLDSKNRLTIPAKLRLELGEKPILTRGLDNCLALYPLNEWQKMVDKLAGLPTGQVDARGFNRIILAGAAAVEFDRLGRILIPDYLKKYAGFKKNVVIAGVYNRLEIWDQEKWEAYKQKIEKEVGDIAAKLSELGI